MQNELTFFKVHPPLPRVKVRKKKEPAASRVKTKTTELLSTKSSQKPDPPKEKTPPSTPPSPPQSPRQDDYPERESSGDSVDLSTTASDQTVTKSPASYKVSKKNEPLELFPEMKQQPPPGRITPKQTDDSEQKQSTSDQSPKAEQKGSFKAKLNNTYSASVKMLGLSFRFALTPDEKMKIRRFHIRLQGDDKPSIPVRTTKYAELKEAFSGYCGRPPRIKNWLYEV